MLARFMKFIRKRKILDFDAVIEGSYHDEWLRCHYKLTRLNVPEEVELVNDRTYRYLLFGKTEDLKSIKKIQRTSLLEAETDSLSFGPGIVLPFEGGAMPNILERPRSIFLRDGRIFVDEHLAKNENYKSVIPDILASVKILFENEQINEDYKKIMAEYKFTKVKDGGFIVYSSG